MPSPSQQVEKDFGVSPQQRFSYLGGYRVSFGPGTGSPLFVSPDAPESESEPLPAEIHSKPLRAAKPCFICHPNPNHNTPGVGETNGIINAPGGGGEL